MLSVTVAWQPLVFQVTAWGMEVTSVAMVVSVAVVASIATVVQV